jgi:hypothetical protein
VANSDYGHRPYCFDTCHLAGGSFQGDFASSSSKKSSHLISPLIKLIQNLVTTPPCFKIELLPPSPSEQLSLPISLNETISNYTNNASLSASAISIISSACSSSIIVTSLFVLLLRIIMATKL